MCTKTLDYAKLADTEQGEKEIPGKFLDRLQEALLKFTDINSKNSEREIKDRFLTPSAPDIHHKVPEQVYGTNQSLDNCCNWLRQSIMVGNIRKRKKDKKKKDKETGRSLHNGYENHS